MRLSKRVQKLEVDAGAGIGPPASHFVFRIFDKRGDPPMPGFAHILLGPNAGAELHALDVETLDEFEARVERVVRGEAEMPEPEERISRLEGKK